MIGTSVVALPWALHQSGLVMGIFLIIGMTAIATFTALTIVKLHTKHSSNTFFISFWISIFNTYFVKDGIIFESILISVRSLIM